MSMPLLGPWHTPAVPSGGGVPAPLKAIHGREQLRSPAARLPVPRTGACTDPCTESCTGVCKGACKPPLYGWL